MSKLVIIEAGNRKGVMGAIGTDGTVYELPGMKDRILKKKREMFEKRYQSYFDKIEEFENKLEEKFTRMMMESPFHDNFITELELLIPYSCEEEKRFISDYISLVTPEANKNAEKNGMDIKITTYVEKKQLRVILKYSISLGMTLKEMLGMKDEFFF